MTKLESDIAKLKAVIESVKTTVKHEPSGGGSDPSNRQNTDNNTRRGIKDLDILFCMDSNRRFIDFRKLWTIKGSQIQACGNLNEVKAFIQNCHIRTLQHILINVGVNDLDTKNAETVFEDIKHIVNTLEVDFPNIKIILCEITPRSDEKDEEVLKCNDFIKGLAISSKNIFIVRHSNLRDEDYTMHVDNKHISKNAIPRFASNIKRTLRFVYGVKKYDGNQGRGAHHITRNYRNIDDARNTHRNYRDNKYYPK